MRRFADVPALSRYNEGWALVGWSARGNRYKSRWHSEQQE
ncbi:MAG: hypothetical protein OJF49_004452 [Ktedonobacterales bacterium]|nr:MAG: hypothetical protein OJF49_004452 [Ktedonobacterales bacterium]